MNVILELDGLKKRILEDLFLVTTQTPGLGLQARSLSEDSLAVFRVAKEFTMGHSALEAKLVSAEDLARVLRFICWLFTYGGNLNFDEHSVTAQGPRHLFAAIVMQTQAQFSGFELMLRSYGIERQLESRQPSSAARKGQAAGQASSQASGQATAQNASVRIARTERTQQIQGRTDHNGTEFTVQLHETTWDAQAWKQTIA